MTRRTHDQGWPLAYGYDPQDAPDQDDDEGEDEDESDRWHAMENDDYDGRWNPIEQGMYDDDPSPYGGTYSEE